MRSGVTLAVEAEAAAVVLRDDALLRRRRTTARMERRSDANADAKTPADGRGSGGARSRCARARQRCIEAEAAAVVAEMMRQQAMPQAAAARRDMQAMTQAVVQATARAAARAAVWAAVQMEAKAARASDSRRNTFKVQAAPMQAAAVRAEEQAARMTQAVAWAQHGQRAARAATSGGSGNSSQHGVCAAPRCP